MFRVLYSGALCGCPFFWESIVIFYAGVLYSSVCWEILIDTFPHGPLLGSARRGLGKRLEFLGDLSARFLRNVLFVSRVGDAECAESLLLRRFYCNVVAVVLAVLVIEVRKKMVGVEKKATLE
jgi:hypothetical protein